MNIYQQNTGNIPKIQRKASPPLNSYLKKKIKIKNAWRTSNICSLFVCLNTNDDILSKH